MSDLAERVLVLKKTPLFAGVLTDDLRVVAQELEEVHCLPGERLFDRDDPSDRMYIVETGRVGIALEKGERPARFVAEMGPGEVVGEMGLLDDRPRSAAAHVLEDSRLLALEKHKLRSLLVHYPDLALGLLRSLSLRLRAANDRLREMQK